MTVKYFAGATIEEAGPGPGPKREEVDSDQVARLRHIALAIADSIVLPEPPPRHTPPVLPWQVY